MGRLDKPLALDLHCHLERDEDIALLADLTAEDLDVLAITNHSNKRAIIFGQSERIEKLAVLRPDVLLLYGLEWNLFGAHVNIIFPSSTMEEAYAAEFLDEFEPCGDIQKLGAAFGFLGAFPDSAKPLLILNHPAHSNAVLFENLLAEFSGGSVPIPIGVDGFHGHQNWPQKFPDPFDYPGSVPGGISDAFYQEGLRCPLLAGSDFHPNKYKDKPDYPPGAYQRVLLGEGPRGPVEILSTLAKGRTAVDQNRTVERISLECARLEGDDVEVAVSVLALQPIEKLEIIAGTDDDVQVVDTVEGLAAGEHSLEVDLSIPGLRYVRIRGKSIGPNRCDPSQTRAAAFLSSACFPV